MTRVPPLYCPIPEAIRPGVDVIAEKSSAWMRGFEAFTGNGGEDYCAATVAYADFAARMAPNAPEYLAQLYADYTCWTAMFDDLRCDTGPWKTEPGRFVPLACKFLLILQNPHVPPLDDDPVGAALHDIAQRGRTVAPPIQWQRFIDAFRIWMMAIAWHISAENKDIPRTEEYLAMRLGSIAGRMYFSFYELGLTDPVSEIEMDSPAVMALTDMAVALCVFVNDMYSYTKEKELEQTGQSLPAVLMHHNGMTAQEAFAQIAAFHDRLMTRFVQLRDRTARTASPALRAYLVRLGYFVRGNLDWSMRTPRYVGFDTDLRPETLAAQITDRPCDITPGPIPVAAWRWWWDDLA
ncbi:terpene synthase family protein [Nocardia terpenica]|nr:terpene synthase family protein [Nocardia terpenica]